MCVCVCIYTSIANSRDAFKTTLKMKWGWSYKSSDPWAGVHWHGRLTARLQEEKSALKRSAFIRGFTVERRYTPYTWWTHSMGVPSCRKFTPQTWSNRYSVIIIMEICKTPTLRLKALNKHTHIMYIKMENVTQKSKYVYFYINKCSSIIMQKMHTHMSVGYPQRN